MSFEVSESPRTPRKSSFFQMAARRRNGDKVFITGDSRRVVERARSLLMKAARRSGLKMKEIDRMAELAAIVLENPGAPDAVLGIARAQAWTTRARMWGFSKSASLPIWKGWAQSSLTTTSGST